MTQFQRILLWGGSIFDLGEGMLGPLFAVFAQRVGGDILQISGASALYLFVVGILTIAIGKLSDSFDKKWLMLSGYILSTLFTFGYLLVTNPEGLFIIEAGLGLATALSLPTWNALYSEHAKEDTHGSSWGLASGLNRMVSAVSIVLGGLIVSRISFTALFTIMGIVQALATIYQAKILYIKTM